MFVHDLCIILHLNFIDVDIYPSVFLFSFWNFENISFQLKPKLLKNGENASYIKTVYVVFTYSFLHNLFFNIFNVTETKLSGC